MQGFLFIMVIGCIVAFVGYKIECWNDEKKEQQNNKKSSNKYSVDRYADSGISYAVNEIEMIYKIMTIYPPKCLKKSLMTDTIYFVNTNEEKFIDPTYKISINCSCPYTSDMFMRWMEDENRNNYYPTWHFREHDLYGRKTSVFSEISRKTETDGVTWRTLKNGVIAKLKSAHPNWKIEDGDDYVYIRVK